MRIRNPLLCITITLLTTGAAAQFRWERESSTALVAKSGAGLVYDQSRHRLVLVLPEHQRNTVAVYEYQGGKWVAQNTARAPVRRQQFGLAYDALRQRTVLYGGAYHADTWEYDGQNWQQVSAAVGPGLRCCMGMVFVRGMQRTLLFGGYDRSKLLADTWLFDGKSWQRLITQQSPAPRCCAAMGYDPRRNRVVLFGGGRGISNGDFGDTWEFDGRNWHLMAPKTSPAPRRGARMCYDSIRGRMILFGGGVGGNGNPPFGDTWEWDGQDWQQVGLGSPTPRTLQAMAFDEGRGLTVMYGGFSAPLATRLGDVWTLGERSLRAGSFTISLAQGGQQDLFLDAGPAQAGRGYAFLGSVTGTYPGTNWGGQRIPLNFDLYTDILHGSLNTLIPAQIGFLDASGKARTRFVLPPGLPASLVGLRLHHAYGVMTGLSLHRVSGAVPLRLVK